RLLALDRGGLATTIILGVNAIGAAMPIFGHSTWLLALSALVFGVAFFAVVGSTTAVRRFFRRVRLPHGFRPFQLSAAGLVDSHRGDDDFIRHRPDARPDRGRRDH